MDVAFERPQPLLDVPEEERAARVWIDAATNADLCVVDGVVFLIRAFLPIDVEGGRTFRFGVWVRVDEAAFRTYASCAWDAAHPPACPGRLASEVPGYPATQHLGATVRFKGPADRPVLRLDASDHPLALEQARGITVARVHEILQRCLPALFA
jgi:hypothetical protein